MVPIPTETSPQSSVMSSETKVWFITGSSSGLGFAVTEYALQKGDKVVATLRRPEVLSELEAKYPETLLVHRLDVTKPAEVAAAFAASQEKFGRIDVVLNNAGYGIVGEVESVPDNTARDLFEVNFWGASYVTKEAVRFFREVNKPMGGRLIQVSSMAGIQAPAAVAYYSVSKFALEALSEAIAGELHPDWNVKVTILEPGPFHSRSFDSAISTPIHPAYSDPSSPTMQWRNFFANPDLTLIPDAGKVAQMAYRAAYLEDPPLRLPVLPMALAVLKEKAKHLLEAVDKWESWSEDPSMKN